MLKKEDAINKALSEKTMDYLLDELAVSRKRVTDEERPEAVQKQRKNDKLTARERVDLLFDEGSFSEMGMLAHPSDVGENDRFTPAEGVITGFGEVDGRTVAVIANDFTVMGGSLGHKGSEKIERLVERAKNYGYPVVFLLDGGGHRIQEGLDSREFAHGTGREYYYLSLMSGWVPLVSAVMGPGFAGPSNFASLCDFVPMVENTSTMGIAGPKLVKAALGEDISIEELGGSKIHTQVSGIADLAVKSDEECIQSVKKYLSYLPSNASEQPPTNSIEKNNDMDAELLSIIPDRPNKAYDMHKVINYIFDEDSTFEIKPNYAKNIITTFARINGRPVGVIANQTLQMGGVLDRPACDKAAKFISLCDAYHLPIISLIDVPGFMPGSNSEKTGLVRGAGKLLYEFAQVTVPKISVIVRKGYGFAYLAMAGGRALNAELAVAWPSADICAMGIEGAVDVAYIKEYENAPNPSQKRMELINKFKSQTGAIRGAEGFGIDDVIHPLETRKVIADTLARAPHYIKKDEPPRKHGIQPS